MADPPRTQRRTEIADGAIAVLASAGSRGLTHRAVDRHLGIPEGSTSHYCPTRKALLVAAMTRMMELNLEETKAVSIAGVPHEDAARSIATLLNRAVAPAFRDRQLARYELMLEASRDEDLRAELSRLREAHIEQAVRLLREAGADDPELGGPVLAIFLSGLIVDHLVYGDSDVSPDQVPVHIQRFLDQY